MDQLTILSVLCWVIWWLFLKDTPTSIESIAVLFAGFAFNALLGLHLWMKFIVIPWQQNRRRKK